MTVVDLGARRPAWIPEIHRALGSGVDRGVYPGAAAAVVRDGSLVHESAAGDACVLPERRPARADTVYDLASLTKVVATTALAAHLVCRRALALDDDVAHHVPAFASGGRPAVTVRQLLAHSSGLPGWRPYFLRAMADPTAGLLFGERDERRKAPACGRGRRLIAELSAAEPLERPPGTAAVYSDVGFLVLGQVIESALAMPLDTAFRILVAAPLDLPTLHFRGIDREGPDAPPSHPSIAATGVRRPREPAPGQEADVGGDAPHVPDSRAGEVDDDNAYAMGGVAPHAGLFGTARGVAGFGSRILEEADGAGRLAPAAVWAEVLRRDGTAGSTRALGFDTMSPEGSAAGARLNREATVGHLGFTGTSLWIDRSRRLSIALLSNRVHPSRSNEAIRIYRPRFHDAVVQALFGDGG